MITLDTETEGIESPPAYPPKPVGLAVRMPEGQKMYLSWGHPGENNCTRNDAGAFLDNVWTSKEPLLFHHAKFDLAVLEKEFGLKWPEPKRVEDTLFHLFLNEPLAPTLSLKPSAARILNLPPEEQDAVHDWLVAHRVINAGAKDWGAYISKAPMSVVSPYAKGDVERTYMLHQHLAPLTTSKGMEAAYVREQLLSPILHRNEQAGLRVDLEALERDYDKYTKQQVKVDQHIFKLLGKEVNISSGIELAQALQTSGKADLEGWPRTPTGKLSTARDVLHEVITDPELYKWLAYRGAVQTCLGTFYKNWLAQALLCGGRVHPSWNSVRGDQGGTRTGRLSCFNPNFQNIPKVFEEEVPKGMLPVPVMRRYILPNEGETFVSADFHSQEIRVLGHFAEGAIQQIYQDNPSADIHAVASNLIKDATGIVMSRKHVKIIAFSILYGAGTKRIAKGLGVDIPTAASMKNAYLNTLTGVPDLMHAVEYRARTGEGVRSWGGRMLQAPASTMNEHGGVWDKSYVLINYLIQGSSADQTKEAIIRYEELKSKGTFLLTVHDEICISVSKKYLKGEILRLREAMEKQPGWDIPHRAEVSAGPNWATMEVVK